MLFETIWICLKDVVVVIGLGCKNGVWSIIVVFTMMFQVFHNTGAQNVWLWYSETWGGLGWIDVVGLSWEGTRGLTPIRRLGHVRNLKTMGSLGIALKLLGVVGWPLDVWWSINYRYRRSKHWKVIAHRVILSAWIHACSNININHRNLRSGNVWYPPIGSLCPIVSSPEGLLDACGESSRLAGVEVCFVWASPLCLYICESGGSATKVADVSDKFILGHDQLIYIPSFWLLLLLENTDMSSYTVWSENNHTDTIQLN